MNTKTVTGTIIGLCLLATTAIAGQNGKGVINTLDLARDQISIGYNDLTIDENVRVLTVSGETRTTDNLAERQYVNFTLNKWGHVTEIRIHDPHKLKQRDIDTGNKSED